MAVAKEGLEAAARSSEGEKGRGEGQVRFLRARGSAELRKIASGSATLGLWLQNKKVESQVSGEDRSRFSGRGTIREVRRERRRRRRASDRAKKGVYRFRVRFGRKRRASRLPCLSLGLGDD